MRGIGGVEASFALYHHAGSFVVSCISREVIQYRDRHASPSCELLLLSQMLLEPRNTLFFCIIHSFLVLITAPIAAQSKTMNLIFIDL